MMTSGEILGRLRDRLGAEGLRIILPVGRAELEGVGVHRVLPFAQGAVLVGDGGGEFVGRFLAVPRLGEDKDPLDAYTRRCVTRAVGEVVEGSAFELFFPFATEPVHLPFQQLGVAAGLAPPGPLGVQVHPVFGPWWAYRALVVLAAPMEAEARLAQSCAGCRGPCVNECEAHGAGSWSEGARVGPIVCGDACGARLRCPVGPASRYSVEQIAFHARARRAIVATRGA
jgi:hypothetical protein